MSTDRDTTRIVRSWLEEGRTTLPDWVRDDVLDRLPATPQRRSRGTAWRFAHDANRSQDGDRRRGRDPRRRGRVRAAPAPTSGPGAPSPSPTTAPTDDPDGRAERRASHSFRRSGRDRPRDLPDGRGRIDRSSRSLTGWIRSSRVRQLPTGTDIRKHRDQPGEHVIWVDATDDIAVHPDACGRVDRSAGPACRPDRRRPGDCPRAQEGSDLGAGRRHDRRPPRAAASRSPSSQGAREPTTVLRTGRSRLVLERHIGFGSPPRATDTTVYMVQTDAGRIVFADRPTQDDASADADIAEFDAMVESMVIEP